MSLITLYGSMFLLLLHGGHVTVTHASCSGFNAEKKPGKALVGHVIKTVNLNHFECTEMCFAMLKCFSINHYHNKSNGRPMCEMNKASRRVIPESFISKSGYEYIEITKCNGDKCTDTSESFYTPLAHWKLDGSDSDVTLKGDAEYRQDDGNRNVLYLNGTASWAETPAVDFRTKSFTLAVWFKILPSEVNAAHIYSDWSDPHQFRLYRNGNNKLTFYARNSDKKDLWALTMSPVLPVGQWNHVAVSVNRETLRAEMFLNGKQVSSANPTDLNKIDLMKNNHAVYDIGLKRDKKSLPTFKGFLKELVIFRRALVEDEVKAIKDMPSHMVPWKLQIAHG